jgi:hypothetical protein
MMRRAFVQPRGSRSPARDRRGVALVLVIAVVAFASIMGMAILSASSLQAQVKGTTVRGADAQYLAESGVNVALYYLMHPENAPSLNGDGYYPGQSDLALGSDVNGTVTITVSKVSGLNDTYDVTATGSAGPNPDSRTTRGLTVRAYVPSTFVIDKAASFGGNFTVVGDMTVNGDVRADGTVTVSGTVNGSVSATGSNATWSTNPAYPTRAVPAVSQINLYATLSTGSPFYAYQDSNGNTLIGTPQVLGASVTGTLTPAVNNPMNVWYTDDDLTLGDCTINGTIFARGAGRKVTIAGDVIISARSGMPALLVNSNILWPGTGTPKSLTVDGLLWTSGAFMSSSGTAHHCATTVNGALMMASSTPRIHSSYSGTVDVTYNASKVTLPDFCSADKTPQSVTILKWGT